MLLTMTMMMMVMVMMVMVLIIAARHSDHLPRLASSPPPERGVCNLQQIEGIAGKRAAAPGREAPKRDA